MQKNIHHARSSARPKPPKILSELYYAHNALDTYARNNTNRGENFLFINDRARNIIIFLTPQNIHDSCVKVMPFL